MLNKLRAGSNAFEVSNMREQFFVAIAIFWKIKTYCPFFLFFLFLINHYDKFKDFFRQKCFELRSSPISKDVWCLHCCNFLRRHLKINEIKVSGQESFCIFLISIVKMRQIAVRQKFYRKIIKLSSALNAVT